MIPIETTQYVYVAVLTVGSLAAFFNGSRVVILAMWGNLVATMTFSYSPMSLILIDLATAWLILMLVEDKVAKTVAFLFLVMVFVYPMVELIGFYWAYTIVEIIAYVQIFAMGADGMGRIIRSVRNRLRRGPSNAVHLQATKLDAAPNDKMAVAKDQGR